MSSVWPPAAAPPAPASCPCPSVAMSASSGRGPQAGQRQTAAADALHRGEDGRPPQRVDRIHRETVYQRRFGPLAAGKRGPGRLPAGFQPWRVLGDRPGGTVEAGLPQRRQAAASATASCPVAARTASAIGRSKAGPSLRRSAGARFTVMRRERSSRVDDSGPHPFRLSCGGVRQPDNGERRRRGTASASTSTR